jgi:hypothetical protein
MLTSSKFRKQLFSRRTKQILTRYAVLIVLICSSCTRKIESASQTDRKDSSNPYTKKEFEKAKEVNPAIPVEKQ